MIPDNPARVAPPDTLETDKWRGRESDEARSGYLSHKYIAVDFHETELHVMAWLADQEQDKC